MPCSATSVLLISVTDHLIKIFPPLPLLSDRAMIARGWVLLEIFSSIVISQPIVIIVRFVANSASRIV